MNKISTAPNFNRNLRIEDEFYPKARGLRTFFEKRFENPYQATSDRFCWDYWNIPNQYRLLRSPAEAFFGKKHFEPFVGHLLRWGRKNLGCQMISHPWVSIYLDGHFQALHSDVPHGPWSFVYSLTPWKNRPFQGGETLIAKPRLLRYFSEISHDRSDEVNQFFDKIEPKMNRLTVFDPRYPHGVERVQGVNELDRARMVIHGWFTEPRPMVEGALSAAQVSRPLDEFAYAVIERVEPAQFFGLLTLRINLGVSGKVSNIQILNGHLINEMGALLPTTALKKCLQTIDVQFPRASGPTQITLPIEFKK